MHALEEHGGPGGPAWLRMLGPQSWGNEGVDRKGWGSKFCKAGSSLPHPREVCEGEGPNGALAGRPGA